MKYTKKELENTVTKKTKSVIKPKHEKPDVDNIEDIKRLVELLKIHQIELEHQNQELRIAQEELEISRNRYVNLFDFSPIPYFTLDLGGVIKEVNISASIMFGIERNKLIGKRFITFVPLAVRDIFTSFIRKVFTSSEKHTCELDVTNKDQQVFHVLLEGLKLNDLLEPDQKCQVALIDMTGYKNVEDSLNVVSEELRLLKAGKR